MRVSILVPVVLLPALAAALLTYQRGSRWDDALWTLIVVGGMAALAG